MAQTLFKKGVIEDLPETKEAGLVVCEVFCNAIQGEGLTAGTPATFVRLAGCHQAHCKWCDSERLWKSGSRITVSQLVELLLNSPAGPDLMMGKQNLVITGGSPLLQLENLKQFLALFRAACYNQCVIELENECMLPSDGLEIFVNIFNNSPKLSNSGISPDHVRVNLQEIQKMNSLQNSTFKFVVGSEEDVDELERDFLVTNLISRKKVVLMPLGASREELDKVRPLIMELAARKGFLYTDRLQIVAYDKQESV